MFLTIECFVFFSRHSGVGIATTVVVSLLNVYYIVVLAWDLYYASFAFSSVLPWSHCDNDWNTAKYALSSLLLVLIVK